MWEVNAVAISLANYWSEIIDFIDSKGRNSTMLRSFVNSRLKMLVRLIQLDYHKKIGFTNTFIP